MNGAEKVVNGKEVILPETSRKFLVARSRPGFAPKMT